MRGKTRASKSRLVLVLRLIGWESGANFFIQSESVVKQNQSKRNVTFDTQLNTALMIHLKKLHIGCKGSASFIGRKWRNVQR